VAKNIRILFLLLVLLFVATLTWQQGRLSTQWKHPLYLGVYPIAADDSVATRDYLSNLDAQRFQSIDAFFEREGKRHHLTIDAPVKTRLRPALQELPPQRAPDAGLLATVAWSLRLRFWVWRVTRAVHEPEDIHLFVLYHDPKLTPTVPHSLGLAKGLIGVVYAFATPTMDGDNNVVVAHEMLHTVGATDKYDPVNDVPLFPIGYADPAQDPLYPQLRAEIMAGRRAITPLKADQIETLDQAVVGDATAMEIRWLRR
jgi:hypothetical protein